MSFQFHQVLVVVVVVVVVIAALGVVAGVVVCLRCFFVFIAYYLLFPIKLVGMLSFSSSLFPHSYHHVTPQEQCGESPQVPPWQQAASLPVPQSIPEEVCTPFLSISIYVTVSPIN